MISTFMPISYVNLLIAIPRFVSMGNLMVFYSHSIFILSTYLQAMPYQSCLSNISKNISLWILQSLRTRKCQKLDQKSRSYFSILRYNTQISSINFAKKQNSIFFAKFTLLYALLNFQISKFDIA